MKKHLRAIVERNEHDQHAGPDLRGLGNDDILKSNEPEAVLVLTRPLTSTDQSVIQKYNLKLEQNGKHTTIKVERFDPKNFKSASITLFIAAAEILKNNHDIGILLTHENKLTKKLTTVLRSRKQKASKRAPPKMGLVVDDFCNAHLQQSGLATNHSQQHVYTHSELDLIIRSTVGHTQKLRNVG